MIPRWIEHLILRMLMQKNLVVEGVSREILATQVFRENFATSMSIFALEKLSNDLQ
jgi:hypothetical protein